MAATELDNVLDIVTVTPSSDQCLLPFCTPEGWILCFRLYLVVTTIVGSFGNIITIVAVATTKVLQNVPNFYIASLAVADLGICMFIMPMMIISYSVSVPNLICQVTGYFTMVFGDMSSVHLVIIAINRYVLICHSKGMYNKIFSKRNVLINIVAIWVLYIIWNCPPFLGFGAYGYNPFFGVCHFSDNRYTWMFVLIMADCLIILPALIITLVCYVAILRKYMQTQRKVNTASSTASHSKSMGVSSNSHTDVGPAKQLPSDQTISTQHNTVVLVKKKKQENKSFSVAKNLFVVWIAYLILLAPTVLLSKIDNFKGDLGVEYHLVWVLATTNSVINFLIYGAMNRQFRDAYLRLVTCGKHQ